MQKTLLNAALALALAAPLAARDLSTDRPDSTESPYTVDAGRVQVEFELASFARDERSQPGLRGEDLTLGGFNAKLGLTHWADLQVVLTPWERQRQVDLNGGPVADEAGSSDLMFRLKMSLWGDDGGPTAFGLMPFISLPTSLASQGQAPSGGLILPLALDLPGGFSLTTMLELDVVKDAVGDAPHLDSLVTASLSHSLIKDRLDAFVELVSAAGDGGSNVWRPGLNGGLVLPVGEDQQWDLGFNQGLTPAAGDWRFFAGYSFRI